MNIVTISQLIDTQSLSRLDAGVLIVTRLNALLDDEQHIDLDFTGVDIYQRYTELPPELRLTVYTAEILNNAEAIDLANDISVLTKHERLIAQKDDEIKITSLNWVSVTLVMVIMILCGLLLGRGHALNIIQQTPLVTTVNKGLLYAYDYVVRLGETGGP